MSMLEGQSIIAPDLRTMLALLAVLGTGVWVVATGEEAEATSGLEVGAGSRATEGKETSEADGASVGALVTTAAPDGTVRRGSEGSTLDDDASGLQRPSVLRALGNGVLDAVFGSESRSHAPSEHESRFLTTGRRK